MSKTVDERVVEMRFDNRQFETNVGQTMSTLAKLKQRLNLTGAAKGLSDIGAAAGRIDMSPIGRGVEAVQAKFSAMQVIAITALSNITNSAVNAGKRIVSALTIDPIKTGFAEYETQINAVQTILANTKSKGTTLDQVNSALDELNHYADKTIYNFTEMTHNIGTFTAAGIDLDTSVNAIQGIANLAAVSGSTSQQASAAMYQLSQALATGTIRLMDWNSVVNAGMGGQVFQDALKETSKELGTGAEAAIKAKGSFRESLQTGWLTSQVLTETLKKFTTSGANEYVAKYTGLSKEAVQAALDSAEAQYGEADAIDKASEALAKKSGKNKDEIKQILDFARTAEDAATKVKTFSQLWDTLKEAAQSGWTQTWEIIVGDFEEAKSFLTDISNRVGDIIGKSADARNNLLQGWKDAGGRNDLIEGAWNLFDGIAKIASTIKGAFREIFPEIKSEQLVAFTKAFKDLTQRFEDFANSKSNKIHSIFKGIFSVLDIGKKIVTALLKPIGQLLGSKGVGSLVDLFLDAGTAIGDFLTKINEGFDTSNLSKTLSNIVNSISDLLKTATNKVVGFGDIFSKVGEKISSACEKIWSGIKNVFGWIKDNVSIGDIFSGLAKGIGVASGIRLFGLIGKISSFMSQFVKKKRHGREESGGGLLAFLGIDYDAEQVSDILDSLKDSLSSFANSIKATSLVAIAVAVGILSIALTKLSKINVPDLAKSLGAMAIMFKLLTKSFKSISTSVNGLNKAPLVRTGIALMALAEAMNILATAITKLSKLSLEELAKGLIGVGGGIFALSKGINAISGSKVSISTSIALLALSESCKILADAMEKFSKFSWGEIAHGLVVMGGALAELAGSVSVLNKFAGVGSIFGSIGIFILIQGLDSLANALKKFGAMNWDEIGRGLSAMGSALAEVAGASGALGKISGFSSIFGAGAIDIVILGLDSLANALKKFGGMSWEEIGQGLTAMGGALGEVSIMSGALGKIAGFSGILGAGVIDIAILGLGSLANALNKFGSMSWEETGRGLSAMGGALLEVSGISGALGMIVGLAGLLGAATIDTVVLGLDKLASALQKFGSMSWEEIGHGITGIGGALAIVSGASFLSGLSGIAGLVGAGTINLAVQGLDEITNALIKFGSMNWDEIGKGLTTMTGALGSVALGSLLNTLSGSGAKAIATVAKPLGDLADSAKKWAGVTVPEVLGGQLSALAYGVGSLKFTGWGADAIAAIGTSLGDLADSVKKWAGVTVPEGISTQLSNLAYGIGSFNFSGWGADAIASVTKPLGDMADSVAKWGSISVPDNLNSQLTGLADGVKAFSFAFLGGWSMSAIIGPLGDMADAVSKWKDIKIPDGLNDKLQGLSDAVLSFSFAFLGGWSLSSVSGSLSDLADSIKKWNGVTIQEGLGDKLKYIAGGVKAFNGVGDISASVSGLSSLALSMAKLSNVGFDTVSSGLKNIAGSLTDFASSTESISGAGEKIINNVVTPIMQASSKLTSSGRYIAKCISAGVGAGATAVSNSTKTIVVKALKIVESSNGQFRNTGIQLAYKLANGLKEGSVSIRASISGALQAGLSSARGQYNSFYSAGSYLAIGFANGLSSSSYRAEIAARAMANAAKYAAKRALNEHSPSKEMYKIGDYAGAGFVNALLDYASKAYAASYDMASEAKNGLSKAISHISDIIDSDIDAQPTIRPVVDLSDVTSGVNAINGMMALNPSVGVMASVSSINASMNRRIQNGQNDDILNAIAGLNKTISNMSGDTYNVNGVTYDDGSNISEAVKAIIQAAKIDRRR